MLQRKIVNALLGFFLLCSAQLPQAADAAVTKCYSCAATDANCVEDLSKVTEIDCTTQCFVKVETNGTVSRGCALAADTGTDAYKLCDDKDNCNDNRICKACDSSTAADCAQTDASSAAYNSICAAAVTKCLVNIKEQHTIRKCAAEADVTACTDAATCKACDGANCNAGIFPAARRQCYQCNSTEAKCVDVTDAAANIEAKPCLLYKDASDACYTFGTSKTTMTRGCVSDTDTNVNKCSQPAANELCLACATDDCNNSTYNVAQELKCVQCVSNSTAEGATNCTLAQSADGAKSCTNTLVYNQQAACYTQTKDGVTYRGCYYDRDAALGACNSENGCEQCNTADGCNSKAVAPAGFTCIRCRSDEDKQCRGAADKLTGSQCRSAVVAEDDQKCFYGIWNDVAIRGCLVDADPRQQALCLGASTQCTACPGADCNKKSLNGAATMTANVALLVTVLCVLWRFF